MPRVYRIPSMIAAATLLSAGAVSLAPHQARAAGSAPAPLTGTCSTYDGGAEICSGEVPSFDGTPMDIDVTKPTTGGGRHPLMVMLHAFGNNKHEWESTTDEGDGADNGIGTATGSPRTATTCSPTPRGASATTARPATTSR